MQAEEGLQEIRAPLGLPGSGVLSNNPQYKHLCASQTKRSFPGFLRGGRWGGSGRLGLASRSLRKAFRAGIFWLFCRVGLLRRGGRVGAALRILSFHQELSRRP